MFSKELLDEGLEFAADLTKKTLDASEKYPNVVFALWCFLTPYLLGQGFSVQALTTQIIDAQKKTADA